MSVSRSRSSPETKLVQPQEMNLTPYRKALSAKLQGLAHAWIQPSSRVNIYQTDHSTRAVFGGGGRCEQWWGKAEQTKRENFKELKKT